jgi:hypothetical protein
VVNEDSNIFAILLGHPSQDSINATNNVPVLLGDYYADFLSQTPYSTGSSSRPYSVAFVDLNNDTQMDLVVTNSGNANVSVLLGYGNGSFRSIKTYSTGKGSQPTSVTVCDINNDTQPDIIVI